MLTTDRHQHAEPTACSAPTPADRCGCGHTRAGHAGRLAAARDDAGRPGSADLLYLDACSVTICGCEIFRGEADR